MQCKTVCLFVRERSVKQINQEEVQSTDEYHRFLPPPPACGELISKAVETIREPEGHLEGLPIDASGLASCHLNIIVVKLIEEGLVARLP